MLPRDVFIRVWEFRAGRYLKGQDTVHHMCEGIREPGAEEQPDDSGKAADALTLGCIAGRAEPVRFSGSPAAGRRKTGQST